MLAEHLQGQVNAGDQGLTGHDLFLQFAPGPLKLLANDVQEHPLHGIPTEDALHACLVLQDLAKSRKPRVGCQLAPWAQME